MERTPQSIFPERGGGGGSVKERECLVPSSEVLSKAVEGATLCGVVT